MPRGAHPPCRDRDFRRRPLSQRLLSSLELCFHVIEFFLELLGSPLGLLSRSYDIEQVRRTTTTFNEAEVRTDSWPVSELGTESISRLLG